MKRHYETKARETKCCVGLEVHERQKCEIWTRVMGYHRPVSSFNIGKKGEFLERKYFVEDRAKCDG